MQLVSYMAFVILTSWLMVTVKDWRRLVAAMVIVAVAMTMLVSPPRAEAQGGLIGAIQAVLNVINGIIQNALTAIDTARTAMNSLYQSVTWPVPLINQAHGLVSQMIGQYRAHMRGILGLNIKSATLPNPQSLETVMRDHRVSNFTSLTQVFGSTYRSIPLATEANPIDRAMSDMDDAVALDNLKTLKASDQASDLELQAADSLESGTGQAAPGSAPFLTASAVASSIRSLAVTQKMLAAELRQEAVRMAHQNELRKRGSFSATQLRNGISKLLQHN
jgi:hypothetical protein